MMENCFINDNLPIFSGENMKVSGVRKALPLMYPCPVTLVTCTNAKGRDNIITVSWMGVLCSDPQKIGIGIKTDHYSLGFIVESGEFVVNIPDDKLVEEADYCGIMSGRDVDKFSKTGLTRESAKIVRAPLIKECPVNLECVVREKLELGSHKLYVGEVVVTHVDDSVMDAKGNIDFAKASPFVWCDFEY
jgi:flavin reductase (DIM6/NTAB) family NADH-FMN oxidoreductase RutF